ncbi:YaeQ family protein [Oryzomonas sagensis]|uniref:YaeQ family protein n=1 Tax=Oryzomonas sagensis TaxID=2603857 RepID=A0ABQ6TTJ6_9BACT|nr:YaeQ family protein [Oryzomonas sagensis]KAB0672137.1 YaeQ family protein [Oryzomonas sagensis]
MALPSKVYKASLQLSDIDHGVYETLLATVAQHPSETEERLVARLLAYAIFHEPELTFTKGISATDEPDLWVKRGDDRVRLWVEVGLPEPDRIIKASRHSERVALLACGRQLATWDQQQLPKLEKVANLIVISIDPAIIARLAAQLERSITWSVTITEGTLYLTCGEETLESPIQVKMGSR